MKKVTARNATLWTVRAGSRKTGGEDEKFNLENKVVSIDWRLPDPMTHSLEELEQFQATHNVRAEDVGVTAARQMRNFVEGIVQRALDGATPVYVLTRFLSRERYGSVGIARVKGPYEYVERPKEDEPTTRVGVDWLMADLMLTDSRLTPKTRTRLRASVGTVVPICQHAVIANLLEVIAGLEAARARS